MRVSDKMAFNQVSSSVSKNRTELHDLQNQAATQKKINKPSDDPLSTARLLGIRTEDRTNQQWQKNINTAKSFLEFTDQSLGQLSDGLVRAKELAISQANDASSNSQSREVTAAEIEQLYNQAIQVGNRKLGDRYLFGGFQTQNAPFDIQGNYKGDDGDLKIQIQKDAFVAMNIPGDRIFLGRGLGDDGIIRPQAVTPENTQDMIQYKNDEFQRLERNKEKEQDLPVEIRGPASSASGRSRNSRFYQSDSTSDVVGINVLKVLKDLEVALRTDDKDSIQESMDELDQAISQVILARSQVGARVMILNSTLEGLQKAVIDNKQAASQLEDADAFQVVSDINKTDSTLQATLATSGKLIQKSLMDFLR